MDNIRIAVLSAYDKVCAYLDNNAPETMHYYDDKLVQYLTGATNTYSFKTNARHPESVNLIDGNKLAFTYRSKDYYFNIVGITRDEEEVEVEAYSLNFELLNEQKDAYKAPRAMTLVEYINVFDFEKVLTLKINEVSDKSITNEWTGTETMLSRLYSLATVFDAEIEFMPELNDDYSLKRIVMNAYRKQSDADQGIGRNRTDITLRYGVNVSGVTKTSSITDLYTAIRPVGKDGLMIYNLDKKEYDASGKIEYQSPPGDGCIRAVQARDRFPSNVLGSSDRYISVGWSYDTDNAEMLYGQALAELKKNCVPQVQYDVDGYFDTDIGDTVTIADEEFTPEIYLQARVTQQERSFTDPAQNKTTFSNFKELQSQIDLYLLQKMNDLIAENKVYSCSILTDNGIVFKNGEGKTILTASVMDVGADKTDKVVIQWYKDNVSISTDKSITVKSSDIDGKSVYRFDAINGDTIRGTCEVTVSNVYDGAPGGDGNPGADAYTLYLSTSSHVFNADSQGNLIKDILISTSAIGYKGNKQITPTIGSISDVAGLSFIVSGSTVTITAKKGKELAENGVVNIPVTLDGIGCMLTFTYAKVKDGKSGNDAKLCSITGGQIMKYTSGSSAPEPEKLTLKAEYQNATHLKWQYRNTSGEWEDFFPAENREDIVITEKSIAWGSNTAVVRAIDTTQTATDTTTLAKLRDGTDGVDSVTLYIDSVNGYIFKNTGVATILTVTIVTGNTIIDTSQKLKNFYGDNAFIIWECKKIGEINFTEIDSNDPRLSDNGFIFTIHPQDVDSKSTFNCILDY